MSKVKFLVKSLAKKSRLLSMMPNPKRKSKLRLKKPQKNNLELKKPNKSRKKRQLKYM